MYVSQSLLKGLLDYKDGKGCGLVFKAKYIDKRFDLFPPTDAQNLGTWFEYKATGSLPKNGKVPQPVYMARKKDENGNPELTADYRLMQKHVTNYNNTIKEYGFEVLSVGEDIKTLYPDSLENFGVEVWLTGTLDIRLRATKDVLTKDSSGRAQFVLKKGQVALGDLKSTGLLSDKWSDFGWDLGMLHNKVKLVTQPIHYKYIEMLNGNENAPFIFFLYNVKDENDFRIIDFRCDDSAFDEHKAFIDNAVPLLLHYAKVGYEARPSTAECAECPLRNECKHRATVSPITIYYFAYQP